MVGIIVKLILWLVIWFLVWLTYYFLSNRKMSYVEKYRLTAIFFLLASALILLVFHRDLYFLIKSNFQIIPFLSLILLFVFNSLAYKYVGSFFPNYKKAFELDGTLYFAKFDKKYLLSKSFEILYQQIMISLLSIWLVGSGFYFLTTVFIFALVFGLGHVPLFFYSKKSVGLFFLFASIISSFVFPFLILKVEWGIVYSYIFHWIFYIIAGFVFIRNTKKIN
jgi:hypothetical protein